MCNLKCPVMLGLLRLQPKESKKGNFLSVVFEGGGGDGVGESLFSTFLMTICTPMKDGVRQAPCACTSLCNSQ